MTIVVRLAAILTLAVLAAGCSGGDDPDPKGAANAESSSGGGATSSDLDEAWQVSHDWYDDKAADGGPWVLVWQTDDMLVFGDRRDAELGRLIGVERATGKEQWRLQLPDATCGVSSRVNADGVAGLLIRKIEGEDRGGCVIAAALDVRSGKLLWKKPIPPSPTGWTENMDVTVSDKTLSAAGYCGAIRYRIADGRPLPIVGDPNAYTCRLEKSDLPDKDVVVDGSLVVSLSHNSWTCDGTNTLEAYDADSGRRLWRRPVKGCAGVTADSARGVGLLGDGIVSAEPLVLDMRVRDVRGFRAVDGSGRLPLIGQPTEQDLVGRDDRPTDVLGVVDETLIASTKDGLSAYDLKTEEGMPASDLLWARPLTATEGVLGATTNGVLTLEETGQGEAFQQWLTTSGVRDGTRAERLGTVPEADGTRPAHYLSGDLLITVTDTALRALRIPAP